MLKVNDLHISYGGIKAVRGLNMTIEDNKIVTLIGANGAGKSSTLRAIMGQVPKTSGQVLFGDQDITNLHTRDIVKEGIALVPEGRHVFPNLTVKENLILGGYTIQDQSAIAERLENAYELFPILKERSWQKAGTLSGGEQQMLAVARGLMIRPKLLMLDEPSLGLAPILINEIFEIIKTIHAQGNTILLIEQNAKKALEIADYAYVLETGSLALEGTGPELLHNEKVQAAYLGEQKS
ncbi:MAG: ABC transporter ATP-binding protein [Eubacteriales bacterium]|nr:ABC transporter ATP-binding protein [Clostridiales bacterium]MDY5836187.1 ABC transporter ATP-binding protein [Eubacteriales bacterium]